MSLSLSSRPSAGESGLTSNRAAFFGRQSGGPNDAPFARPEFGEGLGVDVLLALAGHALPTIGGNVILPEQVRAHRTEVSNTAETLEDYTLVTPRHKSLTLFSWEVGL